MSKNIILVGLLALSLLAVSSYFVATHHMVEAQENNTCWSINALPGKLFVTNVCGKSLTFKANFNCLGENTQLESQCVQSNSSGQLSTVTTFSINHCSFVSMEQNEC